MEKRTVRIISERPKYRRFTFPAIARWDENTANYITGQHKTVDNIHGLTAEEMEMPIDSLPKVKREKYEYIIRPNTTYHIKHMRSFNLSVDENGKPENPVDYWQYQLFRTFPFVAENKKSFIPDTHIYYLEDKLLEDTQDITKKKQTFKAMSKIMENTSIESYTEIATLLNYYIKNFSINVNAASSVTIEKAILNACETNPEDVLKCFDKQSQEILFVLKLQRYAIITRRNSSFYDGDLHVGDTVQEVLKFAKSKEGSSYYSKWTKILAKYEKGKDSEPVGDDVN